MSVGKAHGEAPLDYASEAMGALTAYMAYTSRGETFRDCGAAGRALRPTTRAKLFSMRAAASSISPAPVAMSTSAGGMLRAEILSASVGHATHWPTYRLKWEQVGSLHKRFAECNEQVGAVGLAEQSPSYRKSRVLFKLHEQWHDLKWSGEPKMSWGRLRQLEGQALRALQAGVGAGRRCFNGCRRVLTSGSERIQ